MIRIHCLVENSVKFGTHYWGEHGLCVFVEKDGFRFFLDAGASKEVLQHNLEVAKIKPDIATTVLVSHGHYDHTTGLPSLLKNMQMPSLYAHPQIFAEHYSYSNDKFRYIGVQFEREEITGLCQLNLTEKPVEISEGVYFSGQIPGPRKKGKFYLKSGENYVEDELVDDAAVYLATKKGLIVIFGCGHAGLINTLNHAKKLTQQRIYGIFGGTHLVSASAEELKEVVEFLKAEEVEMLRLCHCTGHDAEWILKKEFGKKFESFPAGSVEIIED